MNNRGFLVRDYVVASIVLMGIIALAIIMIQGIAINYDSEELINEDFENNYNKFSNITAGVDTLWDTARSDEGLSFLGTLDLIFKATFTALELVYQSVIVMKDVFVNFAGDFGIPLPIASILFIMGFSIITVIIIYVWFSSVSSGRL